MARSKKKWVALSQEQLQLESASSSAKMVGENHIHSVEPIPDHDWVGGTWGLFFSDYEDELRELLEEDAEKYITTHIEETGKPYVLEIDVLTCPSKPRTPTPPPLHPPLECDLLQEWIQDSLGIVSMFDYEKEVGNTCYQEEWLKATKCLSSSHIDLSSSEGWKVDTTLGIVPVLKCTKDEPGKYLKPHKENKTNLFKVFVSTVELLTCPEEKLSKHVPLPPVEVMTPKLPDNAQQLSGLRDSRLENVENNNSKWNWMKSGDKSAGRAKHRLSMFW